MGTSDPQLDLQITVAPPPVAARRVLPESAPPSAPTAAAGAGRRGFRTFLPEILARVFAARTSLNIWQWAEQHISLDSQASPGNPGPYRSAVAPYTRFVMELALDPQVREVIIKKSSQSGVTEAILNVIRFCVAQLPRNILYVIDSREEIAKLFRTRLVPSLRSCRATAQRITEKEDDLTTHTLYLAGMWIMGIGGHSAGGLANKACSIGILDEADKHPPNTGREGRSIDQLRARFKTIADSKLFVLSKPVEATDVTTVEFESGTQHRCFVECPHCGERQELVQERIVYAHCKDLTGDYDRERVLRETFYQCINSGTPRCPDGRISEDQRRAQLLAGRFEWRQTNFRNVEPGKVSLEITDLISLFPKCTLGAIALDLIAAQRSLLKMKHVQAERFARAWKKECVSLKEDAIYRLCGPYQRGTVPFSPALVVLTADKQGDVVKWIKHAFLLNGTHYVCDWGEVMSEDELVSVWSGEAPHRPLRCTVDDQLYTPQIGLIDEGFKTNEVRSFVIRATLSGQAWFTSKGRGGLQVRSVVVESKYDHDGIVGNTCYHYNDDAFKQELYLGQIGDLPRIINGASKLSRIWLPRPQEVEREFAAEICAEELIDEDTTLGFTKRVWKKVGEANDFGDALKMGKVCWQILGAELQAAERTAA